MLPEIEAYIRKRDLKTSLIAEKESIKDGATRQELDSERRFGKEIEVIRERQYEEGNRIREKAKALIAPLEQGIKELAPWIQSIDQKITFLKHRKKINGKKPQFDDESVEAYRDRKLVKLGILYEDEFTIIKLFAAENERPKNRWTLMAVGNTLLRELLDLPHDYGLPIHIDTYKAIQKELKHLPTLEEIQVYAEKSWKTLILGDLATYKGVKERYLNTVNNYTLEDFKSILEPRKVSDQDAPVVFRITRYDSIQEYRLYRGFYYAEKEVEGDPFNHIEVDDILYIRHCRPDQLRIMETGNTMFGNWWSISISKDSRGHSVFNRENWEKTITEAKARIDELNSKRTKPIAFNPPEVVWITPIPRARDVQSSTPLPSTEGSP